MVRLKDIAEKAGVSVMTVSKALRDAPDISSATKGRVRQLAKEMGYSPDPMARGLRTRTTRLIGLVISAVTNPIFARAILAIEQGVGEMGSELLLAHTLNEAAREDATIRRLISRRVDGLILSPVYRMSPQAPIYDELAASGIPVVVLGHRAPFCERFHNVETEDGLASQELTRHLIQLGHRRIAFLGGATVAPWAQERLDGHVRALREAGIERDDAFFFQAGTSLEDGEKAALQLLDERPGVTAIRAANDLVAIGAATVLLRQGIRIPEDVSITGFGNILLSEHFRVPLTTARQPKFRLGLAAIETLKLLMAKQPVEPRRLPAELVARASTAPVPGGPPII